MDGLAPKVVRFSAISRFTHDGIQQCCRFSTGSDLLSFLAVLMHPTSGPAATYFHFLDVPWKNSHVTCLFCAL